MIFLKVTITKLNGKYDYLLIHWLEGEHFLPKGLENTVGVWSTLLSQRLTNNNSIHWEGFEKKMEER